MQQLITTTHTNVYLWISVHCIWRLLVFQLVVNVLFLIEIVVFKSVRVYTCKICYNFRDWVDMTAWRKANENVLPWTVGVPYVALSLIFSHWKKTLWKCRISVRHWKNMTRCLHQTWLFFPLNWKYAIENMMILPLCIKKYSHIAFIHSPNTYTHIDSTCGKKKISDISKSIRRI